MIRFKVAKIALIQAFYGVNSLAIFFKPPSLVFLDDEKAIRKDFLEIWEGYSDYSHCAEFAGATGLRS